MKEHDFREFIEQVREKTDIVEVIGQRIGLGRNNRALCPFHEEKNPSFFVNPKGQYFHCFGCGRGGDVFRFLELYENKPFIDGLKDCARAAGLPLPGFESQEKERVEESRVIEEIYSRTTAFYHRSLTSEAREYLIKGLENLTHQMLVSSISI